METTLRTALEYAIRNEQFVYVGSGSGWFYIGPADENIFPFMEHASEVYQQSELNNMNTALNRIDVATRELNKYWKSMSGDERNEGSRKRQIAFYIERCNRDAKRVYDCSRRFKHFKPFLDREIADMGEQTINIPQGIYIKTTGEEIGAFWTYDEFQRAKNKFRLGRVAEEKEEM